MKVKVRSTEFFLFSVVSLLSIAANLPMEMLGGVISQQMLLIVLTAVVVIALFRYLRLLAFLCVLMLAVGANLPERLSETLGISQLVMLIFLGVIVLISAMNKLLRLPLEPEKAAALKKVDTDESRKAILIAITIANVKRLRWLISHNMEINFVDNGVSPALLAAEKGNSEIMQLLIFHNADLTATNSEGMTPYEVALSHGFKRTAEIIKFSIENKAAMEAVPGSAQLGEAAAVAP